MCNNGVHDAPKVEVPWVRLLTLNVTVGEKNRDLGGSICDAREGTYRKKKTEAGGGSCVCSCEKILGRGAKTHRRLKGSYNL